MKKTGAVFQNPRLWLWWVVFLVVHGLIALLILSLPAGIPMSAQEDARVVLALLVVFSSGALWLQSLELGRLSRRDGDSKIKWVTNLQFLPWSIAFMTLHVLYIVLIDDGCIVATELRLLGPHLIFWPDIAICEIAYQTLAAYKKPTTTESEEHDKKRRNLYEP